MRNKVKESDTKEKMRNKNKRMRNKSNKMRNIAVAEIRSQCHEGSTVETL